MDGRVIVAGAGPVGCIAALALAQRGIPVLLLEREPALPDDPRASTVHPSSLDLLDTIGVAERIIALGLEAPVYQYRDGTTGGFVDFDLSVLADDTRFPLRLHCEQSKITRVVVALLTDIVHAEVRLGVEVGDVLPDANGVTLTVRDRNGRLDLVRGAYVIACDGASSTMRKRLGVAFEGFAQPEAFVSIGSSTDYAAHLPGLANLADISVPGQWCALARVVGSWRIVFPADSAAADEQLRDEAHVERRMRAFIPGRGPFDILHRSVYRVHQRVATTFHHGRVLFAGDAAHANSPLGGMGMNSGIHDAFNAVDKLVRIVIGGEEAGPLLAHYTRQRRMVAIEYVQAAGMRNRRMLDDRDANLRRERFDELRGIAADPLRARDYLRRSTLYESLARANAVA